MFVVLVRRKRLQRNHEHHTRSDQSELWQSTYQRWRRGRWRAQLAALAPLLLLIRYFIEAGFSRQKPPASNAGGFSLFVRREISKGNPVCRFLRSQGQQSNSPTQLFQNQKFGNRNAIFPRTRVAESISTSAFELTRLSTGLDFGPVNLVVRQTTIDSLA